MQAPTLIIDKKLFDSEALTGDFSSDGVEVSEVGGFALHCFWTGTPTGDLIAEGSNDGTNFVTIVSQAVGGAAGQWLLNIERQHYRFMRLSYDFTSGTGALTAILSAKNI